MKKNIVYRYNSETDNYERIFPSWKQRILRGFLFILFSVLGGIFMYFFLTLFLGTPTEANLRRENSLLKSQYNVLNRRLENSLKIMGDIQKRDDNFYRVMMQMEPLSNSQRFAGLDNENRYKSLNLLHDSQLVTLLTRRLDLFDRQLYAQSLSFDQLKEEVGEQKEKLTHIPSILPLKPKDYKMSSGYGYRRDPVYWTTKFHEGHDFAASQGTPVFATADGVVELAERCSGYGNCIDIDHGYNYLTRYAHLSDILVKPGQVVKRGEVIGKVGSTGKSTSPHLHYEVRFKDEAQNPVNYYFMDLTPEQYAEMILETENAGHVMD
ncbi:MAG: M23 family metallopeptidase [Bacteroides sp.]|nr:M23 family metallopeptidase [Bacteroides sp.]